MNLARCLRTGGVRLLLLACAGVVMQVGWTMVWTLSYRLTHGNDFTYTYLVSQSAVWEKLHDLLVLANTLAPGLEGPDGPVSLDIVVNSLVFAFIVVGVGYLCPALSRAARATCNRTRATLYSGGTGGGITSG